MRGPNPRLVYAGRRLWECPACRRREWTGGNVINRACDCRAQAEPGRQTWMVLVEEPKARPAQPAAPAPPPTPPAPPPNE